jgi:hypothetical protein
VSPAAILADLLAAARREGASFAEAWPAALAQALDGTCEPRDWRDALDGMRETWRAAFARGTPQSSVPLYELGEGRGAWIERQCEGCGGEIPRSVGRGARYCSRDCRWQHWKQQREAPAVAA